MNESISELWIEHENTRFPKGYGGVEIDGVCVTSVDTYAAGCIYTYVSKESRCLDIERYQILQQCKKDLEIILDRLDGEAFDYFSRLHEMCSLILSDATI